mgnify:CR=1 FL=1
MFLILIPDGHSPGPVPGSFSTGKQFISKIIIGREQSCCRMTKGHNTGTRQGGDIDDRGRFISLGIGQGIAKDKPALGVSIKNLNGFSCHAGHDITGFIGSAVRQVFTTRHDADDI